MSSIDNRIVSMKFDNAQFERGVSTTISSMDKLKQSLTFKDADKGLRNLQTSVDQFHTGKMEGAVTGVSKSFMALATIGITSLSRITNSAITAGKNLASSLTLDPIKAGFSEYELKLGSIQTILANTAKYGTKLPEVTAVLEDLNEYSDKTIYNFGDMTKNIGLFTNAGIKVKDAASMIKGFSNAAAASGTSAEGAAGAAYQLSQALSAGKITLMDWRSLTNVGMGNKNMQQGVIEIAEAMGTFKGKGVAAADAQKNFNGTLEKGWLTADVMSTYLQIMAGDIDEAKMKSLGLSEEQIKMFEQQQKTAEEAATKVRTFSQLMGTLRESVGSGWSQTFETIFGNFDEATVLFTDISNAIGGWINKSSEARNKILGDWKKLGGRTELIAGLKNVFEALGKILKPIKDAFREIFPPMTGQRLYELTVNFRKFTEKLKVSDETLANLKSTFKGIFSIFSILKTIVGGAIKGILGLFGALSGAGAGGGILAITGGIGDFISKIDEMLKKTDAVDKIFESFAGGVSAVITPLKEFSSIISDWLSGKPAEALKGLGESFVNFGDIIGKIANLFEGIDLGKLLLTGGGLGVLAVLYRGFRKFFGGMETITFNFAEVLGNIGGMFGDIRGVFGGVTDSLKAMQMDLKAEALLKIAAAILVLAIALWVLSTLDANEISRGLTTIALMLGVLVGALKVLDKSMAAIGASKLIILAVGLTLLAVALMAMAGAVALFGRMKPKTLAKGLTSMAIVLGAVVVLSKGLSMAGGGPQLIATAIGLTLLAGALIAMAGALKTFEKMDPKTLAMSLGKVAAVLIAIGIAMRLMPQNMALTGAGLVVVSAALSILAGALDKFGKIPMKQLAKGIGALAASLIIISIGLIAMSGTLSGAAALAVAAVALALMVPVLQALGGMKWSEIAKGLGTLVALFVILGVAGLVLGPVVPIIFALTGAIALLGVAMLAAGVGMLAFGVGLTLIAASGGAAAAIFIALIKEIIKLIPFLMEQFARGLVAFAEVIGNAAPNLVRAIGKLISALLTELARRAPEFYNTMVDLLVELLEAIRDNLDRITEAAISLIEEFVNTMGSEDSVRRVTTAAADLLINFLNGFAQTIRDKDQELVAAGKNIGSAIVRGVGLGLMNFTPIGGAVSWLVNKIKGQAESELEIQSPSKVFIRMGKEIPAGLAVGIDKYTYTAVAATEEMGDATILQMKSTMSRIADAIDLDIDAEPVIAPVLDLTDFRKTAEQLNSVLQTKPLTASVTLQQATSIATTKQATDEGTTMPGAEQPTIKFEQNNYSPKALSPSEIYRNTQNQLTLAKELMAG